MVCDDDFRYPRNYVRRLSAWLRHYENRVVVGFHGHRAKRSVGSYYKDRTEFGYDRTIRVARRVHVLRTGLCAYHTDTLRVRPKDFPSPYLSDLWFAALGQEQGIAYVVCPHRSAWLKELPGAEDGISEAFHNRDDRFTELSNDLAPWRLSSTS